MSCRLASSILGGSDLLKQVAQGQASALRKGQRGDAVQRLQLGLRTAEPALCSMPRSFAPEALGPNGAPPDGDYGDETWRAVLAFQRKHFADRAAWHTGLAGTETLCKLDGLLLAAGSETGSAGADQGDAERTVLVGDLELLRRRIVDGRLGTRVADGVDYGSVNRVHAVVMDDRRVRLGVVWRTSGSIRAAVDAMRPLVATSGSFADVGSPAQAFGSMELPAISGTVVHDGARHVLANSMPVTERWDQTRDGRGACHIVGAHVAYIDGADAGHRWNFGLGPAPVRSLRGRTVTSAIDGLGPLILGQRLYTDNVWFATLARSSEQPGARGLVMLAHNPQAHRLYLVVENWAASAGEQFDLGGFRDLANTLGCHHAVALDGSTSAMLSCAGTWHVENQWMKNLRNPNAVAFFPA